MNKEEINYAIEYSMVGMFDQYDGLLNVNKREGNIMIQFPTVDFYEFNRTGMTRLNEKTIEREIQEMLKFYSLKGSKSICWVVGPLTTPKNLPEYLLKKNFELQGSAWGMHLPIGAKIQARELEGIEIREISVADMAKKKIQAMIETSYGMPEGSGKLMKDLMEVYQNKTKIALYVAYDKEKPIAFANLFVIQGTKGGLLRGAATLPEYREKGIYSNMLKVRKEKAKEWGMDYLIIQANEKTSAPIAKKHGFEKVCTLDLYVHTPE